jgi:plastocyanin
MTDFAFSPAARSNVCVGDTVTFVNDGVVSHTATNRAGAFDTGSVAGGGQATVTIASAGEVSYVCLFHGQMRGTIEVVG